MRCRAILIVRFPRAFLRLAVELMSASDLDLTPQFRRLLPLRLELFHQIGHLHGHRGHCLVALTEKFCEFGDLIRHFRHSTTIRLTGCVRFFQTFLQINYQLDQFLPAHIGITVRHRPGRVLPTLQPAR